MGDLVAGTMLGLSPGHRPGSLEAVEMRPTSTRYEIVDLVDLSSGFLDGFRTAERADTLLMVDVGVTWRRSGRHGDR